MVREGSFHDCCYYKNTTSEVLNIFCRNAAYSEMTSALFLALHVCTISCKAVRIYNTAIALFTVPFPEEGQQKSAGKMVQKTKGTFKIQVFS